MPWFCFQGWVQIAFRVGRGYTSQHAAFVAAACLQNHAQVVLAPSMCLTYKEAHVEEKNTYILYIGLHARQWLSNQNKILAIFPLICFI